jgi:predicted metal-dependent hydrolase
MLRTVVATPDCRPETSSIIGHARTSPEALTFTTVPVIFTWHFYERAEHCATAFREEGRPRPRIFAQIKAMIFFSAYHGSS